MTSTERALMPDYLRLFALFGIVVVNVQFMAFSSLHGFVEPAGKTALDAATLWLVNGLALLKTYGLFSFMFGVGLGFLMRSAARRGMRFGTMYRNRMIGLLLLGLVHGCLFFVGDILVIYAITGSILYRFRAWPVRRLVQVGIALLVVQPIISLPLLLLPADTPADLLAFEQFALIEGSILDAALFRSIGFAFTLPAFLFIQGTSALGWFCLGLASVKSGMIDNAEHPLWYRARHACLLPGVLLSLVGAGLWQWGPAAFGLCLTVLAAPLTTVGYLGVIAAIARPPGPWFSATLKAGGSSLSVYLGQSLVLTTVFAGYGLGLWESVDRFTATGLAVLVTAGLIAALSLWRIHFSQGPVEWVLRRITYLGVHEKS